MSLFNLEILVNGFRFNAKYCPILKVFNKNIMCDFDDKVVLLDKERNPTGYIYRSMLIINYQSLRIVEPAFFKRLLLIKLSHS